jgi:hypothetical protein
MYELAKKKLSPQHWPNNTLQHVLLTVATDDITGPVTGSRATA